MAKLTKALCTSVLQTRTSVAHSQKWCSQSHAQNTGVKSGSLTVCEAEKVGMIWFRLRKMMHVC